MPKRSEKRDTAKAEYVARRGRGEEVNLRELAEQMGVNYKTLRDWKVKDKWDEAVPPKKRGGQPGNKNSKGKRNAAGSHKGAPTGKKTELTAPSFLLPCPRKKRCWWRQPRWRSGRRWNMK